jgi:hypothetical protein
VYTSVPGIGGSIPLHAIPCVHGLTMPGMFYVGLGFSARGTTINDAGDPVYSGDAANKAYVDRVTPRINYDFAQEGDTEKVNISDAILSMKSNRITDLLAEPVLDSDAATKGRVDAAVTYTQGIVGDVLQTINNLQYQVNDIMNSMAMEIPSTTYMHLFSAYPEFKFELQAATSTVSLLQTNENTVYTNLRLVIKVIRVDGAIDKEVTLLESQLEMLSSSECFTQKYTFSTYETPLMESVETAAVIFDLMCDIYATGRARPYI